MIIREEYKEQKELETNSSYSVGMCVAANATASLAFIDDLTADKSSRMISEV